jgi:hypothetical protein
MVLGAAVAGGLLAIFAVGTMTLSGDLQVVPTTGLWALPTAAVLLILAIAGVRWERAAAGAAAVSILPLIVGVALATSGLSAGRLGSGSVGLGSILIGSTAMTIAGAAVLVRRPNRTDW